MVMKDGVSEAGVEAEREGASEGGGIAIRSEGQTVMRTLRNLIINGNCYIDSKVLFLLINFKTRRPQTTIIVTFRNTVKNL